MGMRVNERLKKSIFSMQNTVDYCLGRVKLNVLPSPGVLETHILPPCASMIVFAIDKPSPEPFVSLFTR
jgi:hypothetical protein